MNRERRSRAGTPGAPLTARQVATVGMVAEGLTYAEIGAKTGVAAGTVRDHMQVISAKLEARTLAHVVHRAWQTGVLT